MKLILTLPKPNPTHTAKLAAARGAHTRSGDTLGHEELAAATRILHTLYGTHAARLLAVKDIDDDGTLTIDALLLFDRDGDPLWFSSDTDRYDCDTYPGADTISNRRGRPRIDLDLEVVATVEYHLELACTAFGGLGGALTPAVDDHFSFDMNLVALDLGQALTRPRSARRFARLRHLIRTATTR